MAIMRFRRSFVVWPLVVVAALYCLACGGLMVAERSLVYVPTHAATTPAEAELEHTSEIQIRTDDGETLNAWYLDAGSDAPLALLFHGSGGSLEDCVDGIDTLSEFGFSVLAVDYRGYGKSSGTPSEDGMHKDAEATLAYALAHGHTLAQTVVVGQSLGTNIAVHLAAQHPFAGVLLYSPFTSAADVAAFRYPIFPVHWLMHDQFHSDDQIARIKAPLLILHGERDDIVPFRFGQRLFEMAQSPKTFVPIPGGDHFLFGVPEAKRPVRDWLETLEIGIKPIKT